MTFYNMLNRLVLICAIVAKINGDVDNDIRSEEETRHNVHLTKHVKAVKPKMTNNSIESIININTLNGNENPFLVFSIEDIIAKHQIWKKLFPRIVPHYAVKCNNLPLVVNVFAELGLSFDCSSPAEVEQVMSYGVKADRIVFANTVKPVSFLRYVKSVGVDLMTFDNEEELNKIAAIYPNARLLLRIKTNDTFAVRGLSKKFGANVSKFEPLLKKAKSLNLTIVGIAFHVGSDCRSTLPYRDAIQRSRQAFDIALGLGFKMTYLDIGGGFPGNYPLKLMDEIALAVNDEIDIQFAPNISSGLKIISEPGRYFAKSAFTLLTHITSKRVEYSNDDQKEVIYYINDGTYGSVPHLSQIVEPVPLIGDNDTKVSASYSSTFYGPTTCDSQDRIKVRTDFRMIEMSVGQWLVIKDAGAYSLSQSTHFNGLPVAKVIPFVSDSAKQVLSKFKNSDLINQLLRDYYY